MLLRCSRCRRAIQPDDAMVVVCVGEPKSWGDPDVVARRLEAAAVRWHYGCAPTPVRQYASALLPRERRPDADRDTE